MMMGSWLVLLSLVLSVVQCTGTASGEILLENGVLCTNDDYENCVRVHVKHPNEEEGVKIDAGTLDENVNPALKVANFRWTLDLQGRVGRLRHVNQTGMCGSHKGFGQLILEHCDKAVNWTFSCTEAGGDDLTSCLTPDSEGVIGPFTLHDPLSDKCVYHRNTGVLVETKSCDSPTAKWVFRDFTIDTAQPTKIPSMAPTARPTKTGKPTKSPTPHPSKKVTSKPTHKPTKVPTVSHAPSQSPTIPPVTRLEPFTDNVLVLLSSYDPVESDSFLAVGVVPGVDADGNLRKPRNGEKLQLQDFGEFDEKEDLLENNLIWTFDEERFLYLRGEERLLATSDANPHNIKGTVNVAMIERRRTSHKEKAHWAMEQRGEGFRIVLNGTRHCLGVVCFAHGQHHPGVCHSASTIPACNDTCAEGEVSGGIVDGAYVKLMPCSEDHDEIQIFALRHVDSYHAGTYPPSTEDDDEYDLDDDDDDDDDNNSTDDDDDDDDDSNSTGDDDDDDDDDDDGSDLSKQEQEVNLSVIVLLTFMSSLIFFVVMICIARMRKGHVHRRTRNSSNSFDSYDDDDDQEWYNSFESDGLYGDAAYPITVDSPSEKTTKNEGAVSQDELKERILNSHLQRQSRSARNHHHHQSRKSFFEPHVQHFEQEQGGYVARV